jgi:hypothetical protein
MGVERQRLQFDIPSAATDLAALRLDPTNRPGYLRLYAMTLSAANGERVWHWDGDKPLELARTNQLQLVHGEEGDGVLLVCEGDDPWFELPIPSAQLASLRGGGALAVELSWPQSADSHLVIRRLIGRGGEPGRVAELTRLNADMRAHIRTLSVEIEEQQKQLRAARAQLAQINRSFTFRVGRPFHAIVNRLRRP